MGSPLLVVEDHPETLRTLERLFEAHGFVVASASSLSSARARLAAGRFAMIVLDWMLPDGAGVDLCRKLRSGGDGTPILMLTARGEVGDRVDGLDAGADDYLRKPFAPAELMARTRALVRRGTCRVAEVVHLGRAEVRMSAREVFLGDARIALTAREFAILEVLLQRRGEAVSRADIIESAWGDDHASAEASLEVLISRLRRKLTPGGDPSPVETLRGYGYRIRGER
jgi:two-component system response regulator MprA